jgi:hypothetical protein
MPGKERSIAKAQSPRQGISFTGVLGVLGSFARVMLFFSVKAPCVPDRAGRVRRHAAQNKWIP